MYIYMYIYIYIYILEILFCSVPKGNLIVSYMRQQKIYITVLLFQSECAMIDLDIGHKCYLSATLSDMHLERWRDSHMLSDLQNVIEE